MVYLVWLDRIHHRNFGKIRRSLSRMLYGGGSVSYKEKARRRKKLCLLTTWRVMMYANIAELPSHLRVVLVLGRFASLRWFWRKSAGLEKNLNDKIHSRTFPPKRAERPRTRQKRRDDLVKVSHSVRWWRRRMSFSHLDAVVSVIVFWNIFFIFRSFEY